MKITLDVLRRFTDLPDDPGEARVLLDEVGLEVKRIDPGAPGVPITLELLANRGDHHGYVGLAREIVGRTGGPLRSPRPAALSPGATPHPVVVERPDLCPVYTLTKLTRGEGADALDAEALELLASAGLDPVHPVVDATNVANLELGQPTHAFDADTIEGAVTIRTTAEGETAHPLFADGPVTLPEGTLVIADDEKILAIAGVIGCEESKTTEHTTTVLLESAAFDPVAVRKASRALSIHTDSSARFERGSDHALPLTGAARVAELLAPVGWTVQGDTGLTTSWTDPLRTIRWSPAAARDFLQIDEDDATLADRLTRYGFVIGPCTDVDPVSGEVRDPERLEAVVPSWRLWDVEHVADLYEELAKSIGYDNTPISLPPVQMGSVPSRRERQLEAAIGVLLGQGFYEVITDGFHGRGLSEALGLPEGHPLTEHVETANALDRAYSLLKNSPLPQAVEGLAANARVKAGEMKVYEVTRTFHPDASADNGLCTERDVLWALAHGPSRPATWAGRPRPSDAVFLKGVLVEIATATSVPLQLGPVDPTVPTAALLHPHRHRPIVLEGEVVGVLGEVHPRVVAAFKLKKKVRPVYLELSVDALDRDPVTRPFVEPPRTPPVERNLAFTLPHGVEAGEVVRVMREAGPAWLQDVAIVDLYEHEHDGEPVRTFTYALLYANEGGDRSADAMNAATEALVAAVDAALGGRGVSLRG